MAVFVSPSRLDRIKQFFSRQVTDGEDPRKLFSLPVYLRKDGCVLRVGSIAQVEKKSENDTPLYCIKAILISWDLDQVQINNSWRYFILDLLIFYFRFSVV